MRICMDEPLPRPPETIITELITYTLIQNKRFFFNIIKSALRKKRKKKKSALPRQSVPGQNLLFISVPFSLALLCLLS